MEIFGSVSNAHDKVESDQDVKDGVPSNPNS